MILGKIPYSLSIPKYLLVTRFILASHFSNQSIHPRFVYTTYSISVAYQPSFDDSYVLLGLLKALHAKPFQPTFFTEMASAYRVITKYFIFMVLC